MVRPHSLLGMRVECITGAGYYFLQIRRARGSALFSDWRVPWDQRQGMASPIYVSDRAFLMQAGVLVSPSTLQNYRVLGQRRSEVIFESYIDIRDRPAGAS